VFMNPVLFRRSLPLLRKKLSDSQKKPFSPFTLYH